MALGDNTYNNNDQQFRPTVYGYSLYNTDNDYEKSRLTFTMWARTIKISIEEMTREEWLDYLERHYGNNVELVIDKCLFWQDYNNEDICKVHGWEKACTKVEGLLHIY